MKYGVTRILPGETEAAARVNNFETLRVEV